MRGLVLTIAALAACGDDTWLQGAHVLVDGFDEDNTDCRTGVCGHNENTDLISWGGATYLVHRTALSQVLGPNSSLRVYRSDDDGATFALLAIIPAPVDRDLRDPAFYVIDGNLAIKAITRLPVNSTRDSDVDSISVNTISSDGGTTWSPLAAIGPPTWSFWRVRDDAEGTHYSAAYEDGDRSVKLFASTDGNLWTPGAVIYDVAVDTPLETELVFQGDDDLLALVRVDGTDDELLGNKGRLRTIVCQAHRPFATFACPYELDGVRLDGPVAFQWKNRLFVIARKHFIEPEDRKRTALYELVPGGLGKLGWVEHGEMPSAGDTAYAGAAFVGDGNHVLATWYSTNIKQDGPWARAIFGPTDIWQATIDLTAL